MKSKNNRRTPTFQFTNSWENSNDLLEALPHTAKGQIIAMATRGDMIFSLLSKNPREVQVLDNNSLQFHLIELKKMAIKYLSYAEVLEFLGYTDSYQRGAYYLKLKGWLSYEAQIFWDANRDFWEKGIIFQGKFEKYFCFFAQWILPLIHSKKVIAHMFAQKSPEEQRHFYIQTWNTFTWRLAFKLFFNKHILKRFGLQAATSETGNKDVNIEDLIFKQVQGQLSGSYAAQNPLLKYILSGNFESYLPHFLQPDQFDEIKSNIDKIILKKKPTSKQKKDPLAPIYIQLPTIKALA